MSSLSLVQSWALQRPVVLVLSAVMLLVTTGGFFGPSGMISILNRTQSRELQGSRLLLHSSAVHVAAMNARDSLWSTMVRKTTRMSLIPVFCRGDILARELPRPAMLVRVQTVTFQAASLHVLVHVGSVTSWTAVTQGSVMSQLVFCLSSRE